MRPNWVNLSEGDRAAYHATIAFLDGRLSERAAVEWALRLNPNDTIKRLALLELINGLDWQQMKEPWRAAWCLIEESWSKPALEEDGSTAAYRVQQRLNAGDRSGSLINAIVELVAPRLKVEAFSDASLRFLEPPKRPKKVEDLLSARLTCRAIVDPDMLGLKTLTERSLLMSLALALDAAVVEGLEIARRIGWDGKGLPWQIGQLNCVYYVPVAERLDGAQEPDAFHRGISPSVKLLHATVSRLVDIDPTNAVEFLARWKLRGSPVHLRLWAALARNPRLTSAHEVGEFLLSLSDRAFWNLYGYPEIAELRARRFNGLALHEQRAITGRIRKRPPRSQWPREADADAVDGARLYWALRELRRIEIAGAPLPKRDKAWLNARIHSFPDLVQMTRLDEGFLYTARDPFTRPSDADNHFDFLAGKQRLKALEDALASPRGGYHDHSAGRAVAWIRQLGNPAKILGDLESIPDAGAAFPGVWEWFGSMHTPAPGDGGDGAQRQRVDSARVLSLLAKLPEATLHQAIDGMSLWLFTWREQVVVLAQGLTVWLKLWPISVEVTNAQQTVEEEIQFNWTAQSSNHREPAELDTLSTPAGKLVRVFLAACPTLQENEHPFATDGAPRTMRDTIIAAAGRSGLMARRLMIEALDYFHCAAPDWTRENLIEPTMAETSEAMTLWGAIAARRTHSSDVLRIIGGWMAERATDRRLGRETRQSLVFSLIVECLYAFHEQRKPAVPHERIQQMIRLLDDEVRVSGAEVVQRFIQNLSAHPKEEEETPLRPDELFRSVAAPFLKQVWPQERSLATPGVSRALADLPATSREAFAEAVEAVERFLVPFECWSLLDYGLYGEEDGKPKLSIIDSHQKAHALLRLLDLTIGAAERAVIPHSLADALDQIRTVSPNLLKRKEFRRLSAAARRI
ncbi:MAG: hypothetical protein WAN46_19480 [Gammaproteobacteria bacterium]